MKVIILATALTLPTYLLAKQHAQPKETKTAQFVIHIERQTEILESLNIYYWNNYIYPTYHEDSSSRIIKVDKNNNYKFKIPCHNTHGRMYIYNSEIGLLFDDDIYEQNDSINIRIQLRGTDDYDITFSGRGAEKYQYLRKIHSYSTADKKIINSQKTLSQLLHVTDSIVDSHVSLLSHYALSQNTKEILKLDATGDVQKNLLVQLQLLNKTSTSTEKTELTKTLDDINIYTSKNVVNSKQYIEYLYELKKTKIILTKQVVSFKDLYNEIKRSYRGSIREKLITYALINNWDIYLFFNGINADEFTNCMKDALTIINSTYLKEIVSNQLNSLGKGAKAFDFSLPDSTGKIINLRDFRGKVVFIDIWANPCGGCIQFKKGFEKSVLPHIKDNKDIVIISINLNEEKNKWITGLTKYSNPNFINIYTSGQGWNHPLVNHYKIIGIPFLLLIDRNGNIYSSTIPYLGRDKELLNLFNEALN